MPRTRRSLRGRLAVLALVLAATFAVPVAASPAPVQACPPCDRGFTSAADHHGLDTEVAHSEAVVRLHENGSATWTVRVVPTSERALDRLAENESLARAVAADSFGTRYGDGIDHRLLAADVRDGAFVIRYVTLDVVQDGPLGTRVVTYFRDSPGAYIYTGLGADELTVVAAEGRTVVRGFGQVDGRRMTARRLPETRDGPFVVTAPSGSPAPGLLGTLAVGEALGGVILGNLLLFVLLPGGILVGGLAAVRRLLGSRSDRDPRYVGGLVAGLGTVVGAALFAADVVVGLSAGYLVGPAVAAVSLALGGATVHPAVRRRLTAGVPAAVGLLLGGLTFGAAVTVGGLGTTPLGGFAAVAAAVLPGAVALGLADAGRTGPAWLTGGRLFAGLAVVVLGGFLVLAPLTALGGGLFLLIPLLVIVGAAGVLAVSVPLYLVGLTVGGDASESAATP